MPVPEHDRLTFSGIRGTTAVPLDDWSFSLNLEPHATGPSLDDAGLNALADAGRLNYLNELNALLQADTHLTRVRYSVLDDLGHTKTRTDGSYLHGNNEVTLAGGAASTALPLQCALVVSLGTARAGASGKGRVFLPMPGYTPTPADKLLSIVQVEAVAAAAKEFLDTINTGFGGGAVVVASSKGYLTPVTHVRVGRVIDTLRSRRSALEEGYVTEVLA